MKILPIIIAGLLLLAGCSGGYRDLGRIKSSEALRVAVRGAAEDMYAYYEDGSAYGLEIDLIEEFAMELEVYPEYAPADGEDALKAAVDSGEADIAVGRLSLGAPENYGLGYSLPYYREKLVFIFAAGKTYTEAAELSGLSVGVVGEDAMEAAELYLPDNASLAATEASLAAGQLSSGGLDAVMCTYTDAAGILSAARDVKCVELSGVPPLMYCAYINSSNTGLLTAYNDFVTRLQLDELGEYYDEEDSGGLFGNGEDYGDTV